MGHSLVMATANGRERVFPLQKERTVLGRITRCDLRLAIPSVASEHCEIVREESRVVLRNLASESDTLHNGTRIDEALLKPGDTITIGPTTFTLRLDGTPETPAVEVESKSASLSEVVPNETPAPEITTTAAATMKPSRTKKP